MYGLKEDWEAESKPRCFVLADYEGAEPRWCPGCGDHGVLGALQRMARDRQLAPEKTVVVSGIGCSSRFPHYMKTYGFHGLHGRALPVAEGIRSRRPDLNLFVVTGDGDCCAIGTAHWIHSIRYNMKMTVVLLDNNIYGLTKMQSSPTSPVGTMSNTHPRGVPIEPINPLAVTLGISNASFVAQSVDWNPAHVYATLQAAQDHSGLSFIRILQRCPHYLPHLHDAAQQDASRLLLLTHPDGVQLDPAVLRLFPNKVEHDPADLKGARDYVARQDVAPIGLLYRREDAPRYDLDTARGMEMTSAEKLEGAQAVIDQFLI